MSKMVTRFKKAMRREEGFTLVELLVVVGIIGLLAVALVPNVFNAMDRARNAALLASVAKFQTALEVHNIDEGSYPTFQDASTGEFFDWPNNPFDTDSPLEITQGGEPASLEGVSAGAIYYDLDDDNNYTLFAYGRVDGDVAKIFPEAD